MIDSSIRDIANRAGGIKAFAQRLGIRHQSLHSWRNGVPPDRVLKVEEITGISRHELRPDIYGEAPRPARTEGVAA